LGGLYSGGLIFGGGAYIWNEVSVSISGGLIFGGGLIVGGLRYRIKLPRAMSVRGRGRHNRHCSGYEIEKALEKVRCAWQQL
jgi:hypothetical protein